MSLHYMSAHNHDQDGSIQCLHHQHSAVWQWGVGNICKAGAETEQLSHALPQHQVERQSTKRWVPCLRWPPHDVHDAETMQAWLLGHVSRMEDGWIPKDILYSELASQDLLAAPSCAIKMSASTIWKLWTSTLRAGSAQQLTAADGAVCWGNSWGSAKRRSRTWQRTREPDGRRAHLEITR